MSPAVQHNKNIYSNCGVSLLILLAVSFISENKKKTFQSLYCHVGFFGQVVLWFRQVKYTLHWSEQTSELRRKFPVLLSLDTLYSVEQNNV